LELGQQRVGKSACENKVVVRETRLQQLERSGDEERVVVEIGVEVGAPILVGREQPVVAPQLFAQEFESAPRGRDPVLPAEYPPGVRHATDGERIPGNEDLLVAPGTNALFTRGEKFLLRGLARAGDPQVPVAILEVRR